jgi:muconolactone delta-isomerase
MNRSRKTAGGSPVLPYHGEQALSFLEVGMEYLVTMTTTVPEGTAPEAVEEIRTREAARSRQLAAQGHLLRLWRPPLRPGEWRTLGLFRADDTNQVEEVLASMPLRLWRADEVMPLPPHPNDPGLGRDGGAEFLITMTIAVPEGTPEERIDDAKKREADHARELAGRGSLLRLWTPPAQAGQWRILGLWQAHDSAEMQTTLESLPLFAWMTAETVALSHHPNDPGGTKN